MASLRTVSLLAIAASAAGAVWQGCSVYDSSLLLSDEAGDAQPDVAPDAGDGCNHTRWPARPAADDPSSQNIDFYNALSFLDFGAGDGGIAPTTSYGLDLDGICTCPGPDSCKPFGDSGSQCDLEGGVDNSTGAIIKEFSGATNFFDQGYINQGIQTGVFGAIIQVKGYNGQANDTNVQLAIFVSNGTQGAGSDAGPMIPAFDGGDVWTIAPSSLLGGTLTDAGPVPVVAYDLNAYVSDYTLVGNISDMPLAIGAADGEGLVTIELTGALVVAKLTPFGDSFQTAGTVAGRWESKKLLTSLQVLHDPFDFDASLCGDDAIYQLLKGRICAFQDIAGNVLDDGKGAPCNALSLGFAFKTVPAKFGGTYTPPDAGGGCGATWTDQCQN